MAGNNTGGSVGLHIYGKGHRPFHQSVGLIDTSLGCCSVQRPAFVRVA
jgi:hypothetical protein